MSSLPTLENLFQIIADRGLRVANLFQYQIPSTDQWRWQSNLTDGVQAWEFGRGDTPTTALRAALEAITTTKPRPLRPQPPVQIIDHRAKAQQPPPMSAEEAAKIDF